MDKKAATVAHVPYATDRGTFIYRGNEYTVANQMRLRPGVFTRVKDNGTLEAHVNVKTGTGPSFRVYMEPQTGIFRLKVGQSTLKMYPILRAMGVQDRDIRNYWGNELLQQNIAADDPGAVSRAFISLVNRRDLQEDAQSEQKANSEVLQLDEAQQKAAADDGLTYELIEHTPYESLDANVWLVHKGDELVGGHITFPPQKVGPKNEDMPFAWLHSLGVTPKYRRQGIGRELARRAIQHYADLPIRLKAEAPAGTENPLSEEELAAFFSTLGFKSLGERVGTGLAMERLPDPKK